MQRGLVKDAETRWWEFASIELLLIVIREELHVACEPDAIRVRHRDLHRQRQLVVRYEAIEIAVPGVPSPILPAIHWAPGWKASDRSLVLSVPAFIADPAPRRSIPRLRLSDRRDGERREDRHPVHG